MIATQSVTVEEARALLSVLGALLAAYGFFYTGVKDQLAEAAELEWSGFRSKRELRPSLKKAVSARQVLVVLTTCPTVVAALFTPLAFHVLGDIDPDSAYSPEKAALVLVEAFWVGLAVVMARRTIGMISHVRSGRAKEKTLNDT